MNFFVTRLEDPGVITQNRFLLASLHRLGLACVYLAMMTTVTTATEIKASLVAANTAPFTAGRGYGCGRAYVCLTGPKDEIKRVAAACKQLGLMFLKKAYGTLGNAIYMGYDNADGKAIAKSEAFAAVLNARGITCYTDAVGD